MRMRRTWILVVLLLYPTLARADDHTADLYGAFFSSIQGSFLLGPHVGFGLQIKDVLEKNLSVIADFSTHFGPNEEEGKRVIYAGGARLSGTLGGNYKLVHSARTLLGASYSTDVPDDKNDLAFLIGYEFEYMPNRVKKDYRGWAFRAQVDYVVRQGDNDNFVRLSTGFAYRWKTD